MVDRDDEPVSQALRGFEAADVPNMQKVEAAVRENDALAAPLRTADQKSGGFEAADLCASCAHESSSEFSKSERRTLKGALMTSGTLDIKV